MGNVSVITATRGIGIALAKHARTLDLSCQTYGVASGAVGVSTHLPAEAVDHLIDIDCQPDLNTVTFKPSSFLIWSTGAFLKVPLGEMTDTHVDTLSELHYNTPLKLIRRFHQQNTDPYHMIVIASCSSWRLREQEAAYCGLSAAKATFARNVAGDLQRERPGSKVTLINPGGIRTPFYYESEEEGSGFIDQTWLADYIWSAALNQDTTFDELQILRQKPVVAGKRPIVEPGQKLPEALCH